MNTYDLDDFIMFDKTNELHLPIKDAYIISGRAKNDQVIIELDLASPFPDKDIIPKFKIEVAHGYGDLYCREYLRIIPSRIIDE